jgi:hypothetical protein
MVHPTKNRPRSSNQQMNRCREAGTLAGQEDGVTFCGQDRDGSEGEVHGLNERAIRQDDVQRSTTQKKKLIALLNEANLCGSAPLDVLRVDPSSGKQCSCPWIKSENRGRFR